MTVNFPEILPASVSFDSGGFSNVRKEWSNLSVQERYLSSAESMILISVNFGIIEDSDFALAWDAWILSRGGAIDIAPTGAVIQRTKDDLEIDAIALSWFMEDPPTASYRAPELVDYSQNFSLRLTR
jgi:hypothetical protein